MFDSVVNWFGRARDRYCNGTGKMVHRGNECATYPAPAARQSPHQHTDYWRSWGTSTWNGALA